MATAETKQYLNLKLHPRYKDNVQRYMAVIRSILLKETESERAKRLQILEKQLSDPIASSRAALALEATGGHEAVAVLRKGMQSADPEIRFYSAEALAYLDDGEAAAALADAARNVPAFRVFALAALSALNDYSSSEQLRSLLSVNSVETRYGAFRALWAMNPNDALVRGEQLSGQFSYHILENAGPPMIHVTRSRRPEVVLFGASNGWFLRSPWKREIGSWSPARASTRSWSASSLSAKPTRSGSCSTRVDEIIRSIVELGGTYPDVVQARPAGQGLQGAGEHARSRRTPPSGPHLRGDRQRQGRQSETRGRTTTRQEPDARPFQCRVGQSGGG